MGGSSIQTEKKPTKQKHRVLWRNITKIRDNEGNVLLYGIVFILLLTMLFLVSFEQYRLHDLVDNVSKDITNTLTSTASGNLYKSYSAVRDGTSGTHVFNGLDFTEIQDTSRFTTLFVSQYINTTIESGAIVKYQNGSPIFKISDIRLYVHNAAGAQKRSTYICEYTLILYQDFLWRDKTIVLDGQRQTVKYINKF